MRWTSLVESTRHPATSQLRARVIERLVCRRFAVTAVIVAPPVRPIVRRRIPVERRRIVGAREFGLVLAVLLTQQLVLRAQGRAVRGLFGQRLLTRLFGALLCGAGLGGGLFGTLGQLLLVERQPLVVQVVQVVGTGIALRARALAQAQELVDDLAVVGLVQELALIARAGNVGIADVPVVGALVDVLCVRRAKAGRSKQDGCGASKLFAGRTVHHACHFAPASLNRGSQAQARPRRVSPRFASVQSPFVARLGSTPQPGEQGMPEIQPGGHFARRQLLVEAVGEGIVRLGEGSADAVA